MRTRYVASGLLLLSLLPLEANATLGVFEHGAGIKSLGNGGISYVDAEETTAIAANPASASGLGRRFDLGVDLLMPNASTTIVGNSLGPDQRSDSDAHHYYFIPQGGITLPLSDRWSIGASAYAAGLGPDYTMSPYARFASPAEAAAAQSSSLALKISGLSLVLAHVLMPGQSIGVAVNLQRETIEIKGLAPFEAFSQAPDGVTDVGKHGALGGSLSIGWTGTLTPWMTGGLSYRSKSWSQRISEYGGLLPDGGRLELPAVYGGALAFTPLPKLQIAVEFGREDYASRHAFGNGIELLAQGKPLGSANGPGFGWLDQNSYKLGVSYQALPSLRVRAGYIYSTQNFPPSQTLFNALAPATLKTHYTAGATWAFHSRYELSGYAALAQQHHIDGRNSIPQALGGGEANISNELFLVGLSVGRQFGK
ncbi:MAG: hypothetical protein JWR16_2944 [Nevskia sp.]|nr:hypothetical protein [Nevskia sp.]